GKGRRRRVSRKCMAGRLANAIRNTHDGNPLQQANVDKVAKGVLDRIDHAGEHRSSSAPADEQEQDEDHEAITLQWREHRSPEVRKDAGKDPVSVQWWYRDHIERREQDVDRDVPCEQVPQLAKLDVVPDHDLVRGTRDE